MTRPDLLKFSERLVAELVGRVRHEGSKRWAEIVALRVGELLVNGKAKHPKHRRKGRP